jgi:hypothetical protein
MTEIEDGDYVEYAEAQAEIEELNALVTSHEATSGMLMENNIRLKAEVAKLQEALRTLHNWLVCYAISTPEDMCQAIPQMEEVASKALGLDE